MLTEKQKEKLRKKFKYKNMAKSKSHGQVSFTFGGTDSCSATDHTSNRRQPKPTGFEESYAEAPVTPDEHRFERSIYHRSVDQSFPFSE